MSASDRPFSILIAALGGEGGGVLANWIVAAAESLEFPVQSTSIPGVAQRTGATTYYIEILPASQRELAGRRMCDVYSALVMGMTRAVGPPRSAETEKIASANSAQVAVVVLAM